MKLFDLTPEAQLGSQLAAALKVPLARHEERIFSDSEFKIRPLESVRGETVVICQSLHGDANLSAGEKLVHLLFFIGALKDALATRIVAVVPYLAYQRKDRRTKSRDPVSTRYVAQMFESVGVDVIVSCDVHNLAAYENAFRCPKINVEAAPLLVRHFLPLLRDTDKLVAVSPDIGGAKRARAFAAALAGEAGKPVDLAFVEKHRSEGIVSGDLFAGDVEGAVAIVIDDMICGGTTMARAARACMGRGARAIHVAATHGLFGEGSEDNLRIPEISSVVVTDTVQDAAARCPGLSGKLVVLETAALLAEVIEGLG